MARQPILPALFDEQDVMRGAYAARYAEFMKAGGVARLTPAKDDNQKVAVILVDYQYDFVHPDGSLYVPGSLEDIQRFLKNWFYPNANQITTIYTTQDTHVPLQIFFPSWWQKPRMSESDPIIHPNPYTAITVEDVEQNQWVPIIESVWSNKYLHILRNQAKKDLMIWPYHTIEGTLGHMLLPPISEAIAWHSAGRYRDPVSIVKGRTIRTEYYGAFGAEVNDPKDPNSSLNTALLDAIMKHDLVYIAGQAKSHCVLETVKQLFSHFQNQRQLLERMRFLMDCTSSVQHQTINFDKMANAELVQMQTKGVQLVKSTDPIG